MNDNVEGDQSSPLHHEKDISCKKMSQEKSSRKGWSLTDQRADQEALQEMGMGFLEQDDNEVYCEASTSTASPRKSLKRKYNIENVNPNVIQSPRGKLSPSSAKRSRSPSHHTTRVRSPRSSEKVRPLQSADQQELETSIVDLYQIDEETPSGQFVSAEGRSALTTGNRVRQDISVSPVREETVSENRHKCEPAGVDSFSILSDEMMLSVFKWLPKRTLAHSMLVCKRWRRVACDETLWQRLDLGYKVLSKDALGRIIERRPVVVRLSHSDIAEWHPVDPPTPCRIQYLDLSVCAIDQRTLDYLLERCTLLRKLSLEIVQVYDSTCNIIGKCNNLETLNLTMTRGLTAEGVTSILEGCSSLQSFNISWCNLSVEALDVVVSMLPTRLQRLNLAGAKLLTDEMVSQLVLRCPRLLELDLSDCSKLGVDSITSILALHRLEHLALSRCYYLPPNVLTKLNSMPGLQYLDAWGMMQTASLNVLKSALPGIQVNQFMFSAIARPTVGSKRTSIWGLRTRD